ncbi:MAG: VOC family protein [Nitrospiria bacterium]
MHPVLQKNLQKYTELRIKKLIEGFFNENEGGLAYLNLLQCRNSPLVIDHITIRCMSIDQRAKEFLQMGYINAAELVEYPNQGWWAKVYRKENYPALFIDQDYSGQPVRKSPITPWVEKFGDQLLHHVAVQVADIDLIKNLMRERGVEFAGEIIGIKGSRLRQIFTAAEIKDGVAFTVLELTERNNYNGFYPEQADSLMKSSTKTRYL